LAGNPNFGTFFPDTLAFLVLPLPAAFGLRFALAAVLGYVGARRWARAEGVPRGAAEAAGFAFALSGVFASAWRFFNSSLALALAPWVMAAGARVGARAQGGRGRLRPAVAELALMAGLEVLAGEPVIALMAFALCLVSAVLASRRTVLAVVVGLALGLAVAAPQVASTAQVYVTSTRSLAPFPFLPGARWIHPLLSLGGRVRFPVKWWYVVALALVPLTAHAAARWDQGVVPSRLARWRLGLAAAVGLVLLVTVARPAGIAALGAVLS